MNSKLFSAKTAARIFPASAAFFLTILLSGVPARLSADPSFRLEGIVHDDADSARAVAIINGQFVHAGETVGGKTVVEVRERQVLLKDEAGQEQILELAGAPLPGKLEEESGLSQGGSWGDYLKAPGRILDRFLELRALRDLAILNNAAVSYYNQRQRFPSSFDELISANLLAASYQKGIKGKYRFYLVKPPEPSKFALHADPAEENSSMKYFYVGTDAIIRASSGKAAGPGSPPHDY